MKLRLDVRHLENSLLIICYTAIVGNERTGSVQEPVGYCYFLHVLLSLLCIGFRFLEHVGLVSCLSHRRICLLICALLLAIFFCLCFMLVNNLVIYSHMLISFGLWDEYMNLCLCKQLCKQRFLVLFLSCTRS